MYNYRSYSSKVRYRYMERSSMVENIGGVLGSSMRLANYRCYTSRVGLNTEKETEGTFPSLMN